MIRLSLRHETAKMSRDTDEEKIERQVVSCANMYFKRYVKLTTQSVEDYGVECEPDAKTFNTYS